MTAPFPPPPAVSLLAQAIEHVRPLLADQTKSTKLRVRILWGAAKSARDLAACDVVTDEFLRLAVETNLIDTRGYWTDRDVRESVRRHGRADILHAVQWGQRGLNPFERGSLK